MKPSRFQEVRISRVAVSSVVLLLAACSDRAAVVTGAEVGHAGQDVTVGHAYDFASQMPPHLAVMYSMSWFGIPSWDPQGAGPDRGYANSEFGGGCVATNNPATCSTCVRKGAGDVCVESGPAQRDFASRRRPLAGIYSASAQDTEGKRRVDLMLSNVRRPCDDGAKIDVWTLQLNGTRDTSLHPGNPACTSCEISYRATLGFLNEADAAGMKGVVMPGSDATFYFHFGHDVGMGRCDDSPGNPKQTCIDALTQDAADMATLSAQHPSGFRVNGRPVLYFYVDPGHLSASEWQSVLQNARNRAGRDFYAIATLQNPSATSYFQAFDGLAPWVQLTWGNTSGASVRQHAYNWTASLHQALLQSVSRYPGRVVLGGLTAGFDDFTEEWGKCHERQLPPGDPRDPNLLLGEVDYFQAQSISGVIMETWDDWTEGSEFEPDVAGGTTMLVALRDNLGRLSGEAPDPAGNARLTARWNSYGQARDCSGGPAHVSPVIDLSCSGGGPPDAGGGGGGCSAGFTVASNGVVGGWDSQYLNLLMDVNGDKKDDLVVLWNNGAAFAQVTLSDGTGFTQVSNGPVGVWDPAARTLVMDVNGDGKKDLVRVYPSGASAHAAVFASDGTGFAAVSDAPVGGWDPSYLDLAMDVNGDGKDDLVILWNNVTTTAQVTLSNGTSFSRASNRSLGVTWNAADRFRVLDANGDGKQDLLRLYAKGTVAYAQLFLSTGTGFTEVSDAAVGGWSSAWQDLVMDVNGDGKQDLVILWNNGGQLTAQVNLSGGSGFQQVSNQPVGAAWNPAAQFFTGDVDGDGRADLTTLTPAGSTLEAQVALSNGTLFVGAAPSVLGGWGPGVVNLTGDVNGDGRSDVVSVWQDTTHPAGADSRAQVSLAACH